MALDDVDQDHFSPCRFHFFTANDLVPWPVAALYENIRQKRYHRFLRGQFIEDDDAIHTIEVRQDLRALLLRNYGAAGALQGANAVVAIQANDKGVSHRAGGFQEFDVSGVQKVETSVCENHAAPVAFSRAKLQNECVKRQNRGVQRFSMLASEEANANPCEIQFYHVAGKSRRCGEWGR